jgi:hypothetical protein
MVRCFLQDTPLAGFERMMMQIPRISGSDSEKDNDGAMMNTTRHHNEPFVFGKITRIGRDMSQ